MTAVGEYEMRADGTPRYRMSRKFGPFPPALQKNLDEYGEAVTQTRP